MQTAWCGIESWDTFQTGNIQTENSNQSPELIYFFIFTFFLFIYNHDWSNSLHLFCLLCVVILTHWIGIYSFLCTIVGCKKQFEGLAAAMLYGWLCWYKAKCPCPSGGSCKSKLEALPVWNIKLFDTYVPFCLSQGFSKLCCVLSRSVQYICILVYLNFLASQPSSWWENFILINSKLYLFVVQILCLLFPCVGKSWVKGDCVSG